jgi:hypothetical protein
VYRFFLVKKTSICQKGAFFMSKIYRLSMTIFITSLFLSCAPSKSANSRNSEKIIDEHQAKAGLYFNLLSCTNDPTFASIKQRTYFYPLGTEKVTKVDYADLAFEDDWDKCGYNNIELNFVKCEYSTKIAIRKNKGSGRETRNFQGKTTENKVLKISDLTGPEFDYSKDNMMKFHITMAPLSNAD